VQANGRPPQRAPDGAPVHYERHRPEQTTLYRLVLQHAASLIAHTEASTGAELPRFIKDEFDAFLECGILAHGFLRLRCGECGHDKLLAFSCKRRGFCPSCGARRMSQTAAHLVDHVIPHVPVRQWVLSLPIPLRVLLAAQPELVTPVLQVVQRVVRRHLLDAAELKVDEGHGGAVTLIQRFGSAANLNMNLNQRGLLADERLAFLNGVCATALSKMPDYPEAGWPAFRSESAWSQDVVDTRAAIERFMQDDNPAGGLQAGSGAGNGSLIRLAPLAIFAPKQSDAARFLSGKQSRTTHATIECLDACELLVDQLVDALAGADKAMALRPRLMQFAPNTLAINAGEYRQKTRDQIRSSAYVIDTLDAALWAVWTTDNFHDAVLAAANLGEDAAGVAAVAGQLAGAIYGAGAIPPEWQATVAWGERFKALAADLLRAGAGVP